MPELAYKPFKGRTIRVTKLQPPCCELPEEETECAIGVFDAFTTVSLETNVEDGARAFELKANGDVCLNERDPDILQDLTVNLTLCNVLPEVITMITGWPLVTDADENGVGFDITEGSNTEQVGLEVWSGVAGLDCGAGARYGYNVLPCTEGWQLGDTIEWGGVDTITNITLTAFTKGSHAWADGPYAVQLDSMGAPGPLIDPIQTGVHARLMSTEVPPPDTTDGCVDASAANGYLFPPTSV